MSLAPKARSIRTLARALVVTAAASSTAACNTEAPKPLPAAPPPAVVDKPKAPPSRLKFDVGAMPSAVVVDPLVVAQLKERLASAKAAGVPLRSWSLVKRFYAGRGDRPAWLDGRRISAVGVDALRGLAQLGAHGLDPARYGTEALAPEGPQPEDPVGFELLLTDAWLTATTHLRWGRVDPATMRSTWSGDGRGDALVEVLQAALDEGTPPREAMLSQAPALAEYSALLTILGHMQAKTSEPKPEDLARLMDQGAADLERLRWLPRGPDARYVRVDPSTGFSWWVDGEEESTPVRVTASARCTAASGSPMTIDRVTLGPEDAALGEVVLHASGPRPLLLHGAPADRPFEEGPAKSGCIRLEDPRPLALALLKKNPRWSGDALPEIEPGQPQEFELTPPIPLHLTHSSVEFEAKPPRLRDGAWARDATLRAALAQGPKPVKSLPPRALDVAAKKPSP